MLWNKANRNLLKQTVAFYEIQRLLTFRCQWYFHQTFKFFDIYEDFPKLT